MNESFAVILFQEDLRSTYIKCIQDKTLLNIHKSLNHDLLTSGKITFTAKFCAFFTS